MTAALLAAVRTNAWDLPLFLHVAGAMTLVGSLGTTLVLSFAGMRRPDARVLARGALYLVLPAVAWLAMSGKWG